MYAGLRKSLVPLLVGGAIDTKTDPRQVQPGSLLELENMYMLRTGELRFRNGYTSLTKSMGNGGSLTGMQSIFPSQNKTLCGIASTTSGGPPSIRTFVQYDPVKPTWRLGNNVNPMPTVSLSTTGISARRGGNNDPDSAVAGEYLLTCWNDATGFKTIRYSLINESTGAVVTSPTALSVGSNTSLCRAVAGGSSYLCMVYASPSGVPRDLLITSINLSTMVVTTTTIVVAGVLATFTTPTVKSMPGSNNILIAYAASAGGVTCMEVNPATNAIVTGPTNIAAANATMAMSWLDDQVATGSYLLATAGSAAGVVTRVLTTAFAVSATNVIDAAATTNVRTLTGHVRTGVADYDVLWDVAGTPTYNTLIRRGRWTGAATLVDYVRSLGIVSKSFKGPDGVYYLVASFDSATQPTFFLIDTTVSAPATTPVASQCNLFSQSAGGANVTANCPSSVSVTSSGKYLSAITARTSEKITTGTVQRRILAGKFDFSARQLRPRELGNTLFIPGGIQLRYDSSTASWSTFPVYPEPPTLNQSTGFGLLTLLASYDYFTTYRTTDASGRAVRSAPSVAASITLTGANNQVDLTVPSLRLTPIANESVTIEVWRRGPTASGATSQNLVVEQANNFSSDTTAVSDLQSDANAAAGQLLYTTGNVLENFPPPPHSLLEVNEGRLWVVNAEDPTELWPSKEYKPGVGIGFHQLLAFRVTGDGYGAITALVAMDGRLVVFKSNAIYIVSGDGPDDTGANGTFTTQAVSLSVGTLLPGSVVHTPDGIMFQSATGIYLLSRGLSLTYVGKQVEKYTLAENVVDASLVTGQTQVRFVQASGRCLVWDYDMQRWYTFTLPVGGSTIVSCANIATGWCYATADGTVRQEVAGQYSDDGVAIVPRLVFPHFDAAGINGLQRIYAFQVVGEFVGNHVLRADIEHDYSGVTSETYTKAITSGTYQYEIRLARQKCSAVKLTLTCSLAAGSGGFRLTGVSALVGLKQGPGVAYTKRLT